jgi:succinate dehydrogenase/fumarate reductase flavoprotein subunit
VRRGGFCLRQSDYAALAGADLRFGENVSEGTCVSGNGADPIEPRTVSSIRRWDMETDVAVVGFGGAGACAAIEAADLGAAVTLLDLASEGGGSTRLSSAELYLGGSGGTPPQRASGFHDETADMLCYLRMTQGAGADDAKLRAYCEESAAHFEWLESLGVPFKRSFLDERAVMALSDDCLLYTGNEKVWPFCEAAKPSPRGHNLRVEGDNGGPLFMDTLSARVAERGIDVLLEARVLTLVTDENGSEVLGLIFRRNMREFSLRARRGVVLCAGGFVMNDAMLERYAPLLRARGTVKTGNPGDTGAGIRMGLGLGAAVDNMHEGFFSLVYYPPARLTEGIFVNGAGQRFVNEDSYHGRVGARAMQQPDGRVFLVFSVFDQFRPSPYLNAPIAGTGETVAELEEELDLPPGSLQRTVADYNAAAARGEDPAFHKDRAYLRPLEPPYAALDCTPGHGAAIPHFTLGGLVTSVDGAVRRPDGTAIPGLYAAGRTTAGVPRCGEGYASGLSVGDATFFGRRAGRSAANAGRGAQD